jgi:thioredoxin reductase (NADPH)
MSKTDFDIVVIGGGVAGLTAAHHARLLGADVLCLEAALHGGLVINVGALDGYPAAAPTSGAMLATILMGENVDLGVEFRDEAVTALADTNGLKTVTTAAATYKAQRVIVATGARLKKLGVAGEDAFTGRGVSQCAFCDAGFFTDQDVAVIGGGDAALQEALHLAETCRTVTVVHRGSRLRARRHYVARAADHPAFRFRWNSVIEEITGGDGVEGVRLKDQGTGAVEDLAVAGVFVFVGLAPNTDGLPATLSRDPAGAVLIDAAFETAMPGVFAVGAVRAGHGGRLTQTVGDATTAAEAAVRDLS